ncbi:helix-turn-helix transcriptional regulator [Brevibacillus ruminantium]|uniref:Helix-turn-helix transcriptional regulator n=1 Tax=Brevibacillus ruminantium TaxID=2950604 RepID=A0ABY4WI65_9BACL|nr:helix-turn-helix transcriptional regulator [Brevibacillus ruminantium]USG65843.1 helix-turn-helix transcriptional regulator [Brevibacillus ruminantium]
MERINLKFIARRRIEIGITLKEMAESLGFKNASTYLKYEKGDYDFKANHLPILARKLNCQLRDLFICLYLLL